MRIALADGRKVQVEEYGVSNGGMYAVAVASRLPDRVLRAVPYNSSTPIADKAVRKLAGRKTALSYRVMASRIDKLDDMLTRPPGPIQTFFAKRSPDAHLHTDARIRAAHEATIAAGLRYARAWARELPHGRFVEVAGGHGGMPAPATSRRIVELLAGRA